MITLLLAWIDGKYKVGFDLVYLGTLLIDIEIINTCGKLLLKT